MDHRPPRDETGDAAPRRPALGGRSVAGACLTVLVTAGLGAWRGLIARRELIAGFADLPGARALASGRQLMDGEVASVTQAAAVGPLQQLLGWLALRVTGDSAPDALVVLLAGVAAGGGIAVLAMGRGWLARSTPSGAAAVALLLTGVLRLGLDAPTALALLGAAIALRDRARGASAGGLLVVAVAWAPWSAPLAAAMLGAAVTLAVLRGRLRSEGRALLGAVAVGGLGVLAWIGASFGLHGPAGADLIEGSIGARPISGIDAAALALTLAAAAVWAWRARRERTAAGDVVAVSLAPAALGALGWGAAPLLGLWSLVGGLLHAAQRGSPALSLRVTSWLLATVLLAGAVAAPTIAAGRDALAVFGADRWRDYGTPLDDPALAWIASRDGCVSMIGPLEAERLLTGARGPRDPLRHRHHGAELAEAIRAARCPWAVARVDPLEEDGRAPAARFGPELVALAELYEPLRRLGRGTTAFGRRARPARVERRDLVHAPGVDVEVEVPGEVELTLGEPVRADALIGLDLAVQTGLGRAPAVSLRARGAGGPSGAAVTVPAPAERARVIVPAQDVAAAWRWTLGHPRAGPEVRALVLSLEDRAWSAGRADVHVHDLGVLRAPPIRFEPAACRQRRPWPALREALTSDDARGRLGEEGAWIVPRGGVASIDLTHPPCADACFFAEVGLVAGREARFRVLVEAGGHTHVRARRPLGPEFREPIELPLGRWSGRMTTLSLVASSDDPDAVVALRRPRIGPCVALQSLVSELHDGAAEIRPEGAAVEVLGDELRLPLFDAAVRPPTVELPLELEARPAPCLAVELSVRGRDTPAGVLVGLRRGARVHWLSRLVLEPDEEPVLQADLLLPATTTEPASLVFSGWPYEEEGGGQAVFTRPRVYPCGQNPAWAF